MEIQEYARTLLEGCSLQDKLLPPEVVNLSSDKNYLPEYEVPIKPGRPSSLDFNSSKRNPRFPKDVHWHKTESRALALHFFANHELLAIEIMALTLLVLPQTSVEEGKMRRGILATIRDEQKHLKLYIDRMSDLGGNFGDYAVNDFFWRYAPRIQSYDNYFAIMALTFESANLDFCVYYQKLLREVGDLKTAEILGQVYEDEITHVALGGKWLSSRTREQDLWSYYKEHLPWPLTPARAKGRCFHQKSREEAKLGPDFIHHLVSYHDDYQITNRREWKK